MARENFTISSDIEKMLNEINESANEMRELSKQIRLSAIQNESSTVQEYLRKKFDYWDEVNNKK